MVKRIDHPVVGPFTFHIEAVGSPPDPDQRLVVYTVERDSVTARAVDVLAHDAEPHAAGTVASAGRL